MSRNQLLALGREKCRALLVQYPDSTALLSVARQIDYLISLEDGSVTERSRLKEITIGVITAREIEPLDDEAAEIFFQIASEAKEMAGHPDFRAVQRNVKTGVIKIIQTDLSDDVPYPDVENLMLDEIMDLPTGGGVSLMGKFPPLTLILKDGYECARGLVDYFTVGMLTVVSEKLKAVFEEGSAEVEYFPVTVMYRKRETKIAYYVMNPLNEIKAVNIAESIVEVHERLGLCDSVEKLVIDDSKFNGVNLAVIYELGLIGVQAELAARVESSGCTGCVFVDPLTIRY